MKREDLAARIRAVALLKGQFRLRSGQVSSFYWDKYRFEGQPEILKAFVAEFVRILPEGCDRVAGLELGGIALVTALSLETGIPALFVRKVAKQYGTRNLVEGTFEEGESAVVVEDVITTAGQVCRSVRQMREVGLRVDHVVCAIDRQQGGRKSLSEIGCSLASVFTMEELQQATEKGVM